MFFFFASGSSDLCSELQYFDTYISLPRPSETFSLRTLASPSLFASLGLLFSRSASHHWATYSASQPMGSGLSPRFSSTSLESGYKETGLVSMRLLLGTQPEGSSMVDLRWRQTGKKGSSGLVALLTRGTETVSGKLFP